MPRVDTFATALIEDVPVARHQVYKWWISHS
jgi:hypothetical protein